MIGVRGTWPNSRRRSEDRLSPVAVYAPSLGSAAVQRHSTTSSSSPSSMNSVKLDRPKPDREHCSAGAHRSDNASLLKRLGDLVAKPRLVARQIVQADALTDLNQLDQKSRSVCRQLVILVGRFKLIAKHSPAEHMLAGGQFEEWPAPTKCTLDDVMNLAGFSECSPRGAWITDEIDRSSKCRGAEWRRPTKRCSCCILKLNPLPKPSSCPTPPRS